MRINESTNLSSNQATWRSTESQGLMDLNARASKHSFMKISLVALLMLALVSVDAAATRKCKKPGHKKPVESPATSPPNSYPEANDDKPKPDDKPQPSPNSYPEANDDTPNSDDKPQPSPSGYPEEEGKPKGNQTVPDGLPKVEGLDQSPTDPDSYGKCIEVEEEQKNSNWCQIGKVVPEPAVKEQFNKVFKVGRQTVYNGPILKQKFACNEDGIGSDDFATVAVSTKYFPSSQSGWNENDYPPYCNKCMCISVLGADAAVHKPQMHIAESYIGLSLMGKVKDRCGECADDSIDILMDRPYAFAPMSTGEEAKNAPKVNSMRGLRAFDDDNTPYAIGKWVAAWNWVPCDWTHQMCADFVKEQTGQDTFIPEVKEGK